MVYSELFCLFQPFNSGLIFLRLFIFDQIKFIGDQKGAPIGDILFSCFCQVVIAFVHRFWITQIVNAQAAITAFVIGCSEGSKFFLAGGIPYLEGVGFAIDGGGVCVIVDANCGLIGGRELGVDELSQNGAFANCLCANQNNFKGLDADLLR